MADPRVQPGRVDAEPGQAVALRGQVLFLGGDSRAWPINSPDLTSPTGEVDPLSGGSGIHAAHADTCQCPDLYNIVYG